MVSRPPYQFIEVQSDSLLLVEGIDDARFMDAFLKSMNKSNIQIAQVGGKPNFGPFLSSTLANARNLSLLNKLAIIRDADNNPQAAFQSLCALLTRANFHAPSQPWVALPGRLSVSVAILPDENSAGNLEDLCLRALEENYEDMKALQCVDKYLFCRNHAIVPKSQRSKARLHSYLAVADEPGCRLGEAADAQVWDWGSPALQSLASFLSEL